MQFCFSYVSVKMIIFIADLIKKLWQKLILVYWMV